MEGNIISAIVEEWESLSVTKRKQREAVSVVMKKLQYRCQEREEWLNRRHWSDGLSRHDLGQTAVASNIGMAEVIFV